MGSVNLTGIANEPFALRAESYHVQVKVSQICVINYGLVVHREPKLSCQSFGQRSLYARVQIIEQDNKYPVTLTFVALDLLYPHR